MFIGGKQMMIRDLIRKNRSYRKFYGDFLIKRETLEELVDLARLSASGANKQPLKFVLSYGESKNKLIFPNIGWAAYIKDWTGPTENERPSAYIIILGDKQISQNCKCDAGVAAQSILLGATEKGLGGCIFGSVKREELKIALKIKDEYDVLYVLALGKPREKIVIEKTNSKGDTQYWRDNQGILHIPKKPLNKIILE